MTSLYDKNGIIDYRRLRYMRSLNITEFGTVYGNNIEEQKIDIFFKKIKKNMKKNINNYGVKYDEQLNQFVVVENGIEYLVDIDEEVMRQYALGNYTNITAMLDKMYKETSAKTKILDSKKEKEQKLLKKANEIEKSNKLPSLADAPLYVQYLEKENKEKAREIRKELANFGLVSTPTVSSGMMASILTGNPALGALASIIMFYGQSFLSMWILDETIYQHYEEILTNISTKIKERRMNKYRIKQIKSIENYDKIVLANSYIVEETEESEQLTLTDNIILQVNEIVNKAKSINKEDQESILEEAKNLLNEYNERYSAIQNKNDEEIVLGADNEVVLKMDMIKKISLLNSKLLETQSKDKKIDVIESEKSKLVQKIDRISAESEIENKGFQRKR